jgi:hypothetical protein
MTKTYKLVLRITYILISQIDYRLDFLSLLEIMIEINHSKCISTYSRNKRIMNGIIIFFGLTIAVLSLFHRKPKSVCIWWRRLWERFCALLSPCLGTLLQSWLSNQPMWRRAIQHHQWTNCMHSRIDSLVLI